MRNTKLCQLTNQGDVPERGCRLQKFSGLAAILNPTASMTSTSAPRVKAKMRVEGFEMPGDGDGDGCVFLFSILF